MKAFFSAPQPAAILKHEVLFRYLEVFASKTGSQSGGRVMFVDGYAGAGRYSDGTPAGPARAIDVAKGLAAMASPRQLELIFVEQDPDTYTSLDACVRELHGQEIVEPLVKFGRIEEHLDAILASARDDPMFVFLDPFGVGIDFDLLTGKILGRSRANHPKTEVLLNFSVQAVDRIGGLIASTARHRDGSLRTLNRTLGGDWWQEAYKTAADNHERLNVIARGYYDRVSKAAGGWMGWSVPVSDKFGRRPEYLLMHFTQHRDGHWEFHEALSHATRSWREAVRRIDGPDETELAGQGELFSMEGEKPFEEDEAAWIDHIADNARRLLVEGPFVVQTNLRTLAGDAVGMCRKTHIYRALLKLYNEGLLLDKPVSSTLQRAVITPKPAP